MNSQNIIEDPPMLEQYEQRVPISDDRIEEEENEGKKDISPYPSAQPVCELDFAETQVSLSKRGSMLQLLGKMVQEKQQ